MLRIRFRTTFINNKFETLACEAVDWLAQQFRCQPLILTSAAHNVSKKVCLVCTPLSYPNVRNHERNDTFVVTHFVLFVALAVPDVSPPPPPYLTAVIRHHWVANYSLRTNNALFTSIQHYRVGGRVFCCNLIIMLIGPLPVVKWIICK